MKKDNIEDMDEAGRAILELKRTVFEKYEDSENPHHLRKLTDKEYDQATSELLAFINQNEYWRAALEKLDLDTTYIQDLQPFIVKILNEGNYPDLSLVRVLSNIDTHGEILDLEDPTAKIINLAKTALAEETHLKIRSLKRKYSKESSKASLIELKDFEETPTPLFPNSPLMGEILKVIVAPYTANHEKISRAGEQISMFEDKTSLTIKKKFGEEEHTLKVANIKNFYNKKNISTILLLCYLFQKAAYSLGHYNIHITYKETMDIGIFETASGARRGFENFYSYMHGSDKYAAVSLAGIFKVKKKKVKVIEQDILIGREIVENGVTFCINPNLDMSIFNSYFTFLPKWVYTLKDLNSFLLVRYIFSIARMSGSRMNDPEPQDQDKQMNYKTFNISFDSIRDALGLPAPQYVTGRKFKEKIKDPIEKAIEEIETKISDIKDPTVSLLVRLTPQKTDKARNIEAYLRCYLEVGIVADFMKNFKKAAKEHEKHLQEFNSKVETEKAKNAAKNLD